MQFRVPGVSGNGHAIDRSISISIIITYINTRCPPMGVIKPNKKLI